MREIPDLLLYLWLCAPCVRHQIYIAWARSQRGCYSGLGHNTHTYVCKAVRGGGPQNNFFLMKLLLNVVAQHFLTVGGRDSISRF